MEKFIKKQYKIVLVGDEGVGKSCWLYRLKNNIFEEKYIPTIGVDIFSYLIDNVVFNIWCCSGCDKFDVLLDNYYVGAKGAIVMYDEKSFHSAEKWIKSVTKITGNIPIVIVQNKIDLISASQMENNEINDSIKISVKDNININNLLIKLKELLGGNT